MYLGTVSYKIDRYIYYLSMILDYELFSYLCNDVSGENAVADDPVSHFLRETLAEVTNWILEPERVRIQIVVT